MWKSKRIVTFWILCFSLIDISFSHIVLTFPPARKYAFDFLDNVRTQGPCGVPKGIDGKVTDFQAGQRINVTWHIAYPHQGGFRLALLDDKENVIKEFFSGFIDSHDPTKLYTEITLPGSQCNNCTLQITRQAAEWSTNCAPGQYIFWSCADINVHKAPLTDAEKCGAHPVENEQCRCRPPYSGHRCQFKDECRTDNDCNNGVCVETDSTYFPKRQCYCNPGWFGANCDKRSSVTSLNIDYRLYTNTVFSPEYQIYHRLLQEKSEIEVVMRVKSKTWVGIGWRPSDFKSGCQRFPSLPRISDKLVSDKSTTSEPEPEKSNSTAEPEPENTKTTPESEPEKTMTTSEPEPMDIKTTSEPEPEKTKTTPESEPEITMTTSEPEPKNTKTTTEPEPEQTKTSSEPKPEKTLTTSETNISPESEADKTTTTPEPEAEKTKIIPEPEKTTIIPEPEPEQTNTSEPEPDETTVTPEPETNQCFNKIVQKCSVGTNTLDCFDISWTYHEAEDTIEFTLSALVAETEWVGVGFSETDSMTNADIYVGWHNNGNTTMFDSHTGAYHAPPTKDRMDLFNISGNRINGKTQLKFSRKRSTGEVQMKDVAFTDTKCYYILLAWGGSVTSSGIGKHKYRFNNLKEKMCVKPCVSPEPEPEKTTITPEPQPENTKILPEPEQEKSTTSPEPEPENTKITSEPEPEKKTTTSEPKPLNTKVVSDPEPDNKTTTSQPEPENTKITSEPKPEKTTFTTKSAPEPEPCSSTIVQKCSLGNNTLDCFNMSWTFHEAEDKIEFTLSAIVAETEWIGVGFSETDSMTNADIYYGWHINGITKMHDSHTSDYRAPPVLDYFDLFDVSGSRIDGRTQLKFSRKRSTGEDQMKDVAFTDTKCYYILLAWGGSVTSSGIGKHKYRFNNLKEKMCVKPCEIPKHDPEKTSTRPEPEKSSLKPEPESTAIPEGEGEPGSCGPAPGANETTGDDPHSMDCVDMVIGSAKGQLSRIGDYYSRDRSTPQKDEFYGGKDDLTGALGFEDDAGFTTIVFRKKVRATEPTDHSITDTPMHVIWARGQDEGNYVHDIQAPSGIDGPNTRVSDPQFYKVDELKYHGHTGQRGTASINFFSETTGPVGECKQEWGSCSPVGDCHHVEWVYNRVLDMIHFTLRARLRSKQWIGLGFSRDKSMTNTDTVVAWIDSQRVVHAIDGWIGNQYAMPNIDPRQDIRQISGDIQDGITTISFSRSRKTQDEKDIDFDENDCIYIIFPKGGEYVDGTNRFTMHDIKPTVSQQKICIPCQKGQTQPPVTGTTSRPVENFSIVVLFKVTSISWSEVYSNPGSREFMELRMDIELSLNTLMSNVRGFSQVVVLRMSQGSIKIEAALNFEGDKTTAKQDVEAVFTKAIVTGMIGTYKVDTTTGSFSIGDPEPVKEVTTRPPKVEHDDDYNSRGLWAVVGIASGSFLYVVILACCKYANLRMQKEKESDDEFTSFSLGTPSPLTYHYNGYKSDENKGLSVMNMTYGDWKDKNETESVPSFKSSQNINSNIGMMETF